MECNIFVLSVLKIISFSYSFQSIFYFFCNVKNKRWWWFEYLFDVCVCVCEFDFIQQLAWCWWQYLKNVHTLFNRNFQFSHLMVSHIQILHLLSLKFITFFVIFAINECSPWKKELFIHQNVALKTVVICCLSKCLDKKLQSWCQTLISLSVFHKMKKKQNKTKTENVQQKIKRKAQIIGFLLLLFWSCAFLSCNIIILCVHINDHQFA